MSSATDPLDTPHSDSDSERTLTASFPNYGGATSARLPDATLLVGTRRTATLATDGELFSDALQRSPGALRTVKVCRTCYRKGEDSSITPQLPHTSAA